MYIYKVNLSFLKQSPDRSSTFHLKVGLLKWPCNVLFYYGNTNEILNHSLRNFFAVNGMINLLLFIM